MGRFTGKTAVITGSGRENGLGQAIAVKLASEARILLYLILAAHATRRPSRNI